MRITVCAVGKLKEKYLRDAIAEYSRRLDRYCRLEITEVPDEKIPENAHSAEERAVKEEEGKRLLRCIPDPSRVIALDIRGKGYSSEAFAGRIEEAGLQGISHLTFVIGGSLGLSDAVLSRADEKLSFSQMTFPHQLMRVILLEQIYRAFRIISHEPYHK